MTQVRPRTVAVGALAVVLLLLVLARQPVVAGLGFVVRAAGLAGPVRFAAEQLATARVVERPLAIPLATGVVAARVYEPGGNARRVVLLVSGLHPAGIDEPRLVALARELARSRIAVVTPDLPQLRTFDVTPAITDGIEQTARWLAESSGLARDRRIGMAGISFSGGLSIVAAARPSLAGRVAYVVSFGGHADLPRVLHYLCTGIEPAARPGEPPVARPPHDYGLAVVVLAIADRLVPPDQVAPLRAGVRKFLWASHLDRVDKPAAMRTFDELRSYAQSLPEPSATLMREVNDRNVTDLGPRLEPHLGDYGSAAALSPARSPLPAAPVFLLHGAADNVIPAAESRILGATIRDVAAGPPAGPASVRLLVSPVISHAETDGPLRARDVWRLAAFWGDVLSR